LAGLAVACGCINCCIIFCRLSRSAAGIFYGRRSLCAHHAEHI
jgi:hypothetical protein